MAPHTVFASLVKVAIMGGRRCWRSGFLRPQVQRFLAFHLRTFRAGEWGARFAGFPLRYTYDPCRHNILPT